MSTNPFHKRPGREPQKARVRRIEPRRIGSTRTEIRARIVSEPTLLSTLDSYEVTEIDSQQMAELLGETSC